MMIQLTLLRDDGTKIYEETFDPLAGPHEVNFNWSIVFNHRLNRLTGLKIKPEVVLVEDDR